MAEETWTPTSPNPVADECPLLADGEAVHTKPRCFCLLPIYTRFERPRTFSEAARAYFAEVFVTFVKKSFSGTVRRWSGPSAQFGSGWSTLLECTSQSCCRLSWRPHLSFAGPLQGCVVMEQRPERCHEPLGPHGFTGSLGRKLILIALKACTNGLDIGILFFCKVTSIASST